MSLGISFNFGVTVSLNPSDDVVTTLVISDGVVVGLNSSVVVGRHSGLESESESASGPVSRREPRRRVYGDDVYIWTNRQRAWTATAFLYLPSKFDAAGCLGRSMGLGQYAQMGMALVRTGSTIFRNGNNLFPYDHFG